MNPARPKLKLTFSFFIFFMTAVFLVLKEWRGFSGVETRGGLWNIIQGIFVCLAVAYPVIRSQTVFVPIPTPIKILFAYSVLSFLLYLPYMRYANLGNVYWLLMTLYAASVGLIYNHLGYTTDISKKTILYPTFYAISAILIYAMWRYYGQMANKGAIADVYYILGLFPLVLIFQEGKKIYLPLLVCALCIVMSGKRAGMVAITLMLIVYYGVRATQNSDVRQYIKTFLIIALAFAILISLGVYLDNLLHMGVFNRFMRAIDDGGSGRLERWQLLGDSFIDSDVYEIMFGHGAREIVEEAGGRAHNDFLDVLYVQGVVALVLYAWFYWSCIKVFFEMRRLRYRFVAQYATALTCSFIIAMFSFYIIQPNYITCGMICIGLMLGDFEKQKQLMAPELRSSRKSRRSRRRSSERLPGMR